MRPVRPFPAARLVALVAFVGVAGCSSCRTPLPDATHDAAPVVLAPVAAPSGLLANVWLRVPDTTWTRLQNAVSGAMGLLPPQVAQVVVGALGLDPGTAMFIDGKSTAYAAIVDGAPGGALGWAVALRVRDSDALVAALRGGDAGPTHFAVSEESGLSVVTRTDRALPAAVAVAPGWLVVASEPSSLEVLAPYVTRTLPQMAEPPSKAPLVATVGSGALAGPVATRLTDAWTSGRAWLSARDHDARAKHGGRAPDFGDPDALLGTLDALVKDRVAVVASATRASLDLDVGDDDVRMDLTLTPGSDDASTGRVVALRTGDASPLKELPGDSALALLLRDDAGERAHDAKAIATAAAAVLASHMAPGDGKALEAALDGWASARGDWLTLAVSASSGVTLRAPGGDAAARAMRGVVDLTARPFLHDPLHAALALDAPHVATATVAGVTGAQLATFGKVPVGLAWGTANGELVVAAGDHADRALAASAAPPARVGDDARAMAALSLLGPDASIVVLAEPLRLDVARGASGAARAPSVVAYGKRAGDLWVHADLAGPLAREALRLQAGL